MSSEICLAAHGRGLDLWSQHLTRHIQVLSSNPNSVQGAIHALGKTSTRSPPHLRSFFSVAYGTVPVLVRWTMPLSRLFKENSGAHPLSTPLSSQAVDGVTSLALCLQTVSQAFTWVLTSLFAFRPWGQLVS